MSTYLSPRVKNNDHVKILHITDTHLFADDAGLLLGINTNKSFNAVIQAIKQQGENFDLIVATGDFVQDGSEKAYLKFAHAIKQFSTPCVWLPGNHDVYAKMAQIFSQQGLPDNNIILLGDKWLIVLLNSQVNGEAYGLLSSDELRFLSTTLANFPDRYVSVFLHHHPIMSGCNWLDQHCLKNHDEFADVIKQYPNVKSIGWGHIHQKIEKKWLHCNVFSTPSTCVQFQPSCSHFSVIDDAPGWRTITLTSKGKVNTAVHALEQNVFHPDPILKGY